LKTKDGVIYISKRNNYIKDLALENSGIYATYGIGDSDIESIIKEIENKIEKSDFKNQEIEDYKELFYYPLVVALILFILATTSLPINARLKVLVLCFFIQYDLHAGIFDFVYTDKAEKHYDNKQYKSAIREFKKADKSDKLHYNIANSYYKNREFKKAIENYKKIESKDDDFIAKKYYNMANSYVKLGDLNEAEKLYRKSLSYVDDEDAKYNLKQIAKKEQDKKNRDKQEEDKKEQEQNKDKNKDKKKDEKQSKNQNDKKDSKQESKNSSNKKKNNRNNKEKDNNKNQTKNKDRSVMSKLEEQELIKSLEENRFKILPQMVPQQTGDKKSEDSSIW
jgi:Ca-activated chloride channel family protein